MDTNKIVVTLNMKTYNASSQNVEYIAFTHKQTKSGHKIMIYEKHSSPVVAKKRLVKLLDEERN